jgi:hypothetical protein
MFGTTYMHPAVHTHSRRSLDYLTLAAPVSIFSSGYDSDMIVYPNKETSDWVSHYPSIHGHQKCAMAAHEVDCYCFNTNLSTCMPAFLEIMCMRADATDPYVMRMSGERVRFVPSRTKSYKLIVTGVGTQDKHYEVLVPSPFFCNVEWPTKQYRPAFSGVGDSARVQFIYAQADPRYLRSISEYYSTSPRMWGRVNPMLREPETTSELSYHCANLYGSETLGRVYPAIHPLAHGFHVSYTQLSSNLLAEEVEVTHPHCVESYLLKKHKRVIYGDSLTESPPGEETAASIDQPDPFVTCSACLPNFPPGAYKRPKIQEYNRRAYVKHYRECHSSDLCFLGLGFPTGLAGRLYESFVLYLMCLTEEAKEGDYWSTFEAPGQTEKISPYTVVGERFGFLAKKPSSTQGPILGYDPEEFLTQDLEEDPKSQRILRKKGGKDS